jgi:DNA polymerase III epsilon subunit family exonuclease
MSHRCFFFPKCSGQADLFGGGKRESLVFLDFETTGLEAGRNHITEFGALKIDSEGFEHTFESFVKVPVKLEQKIIQITGITDEMLKEAPPIEKVMEKFAEFVGDAILVAHNAEFDLPWLLVASERTSIPIHVKQVVCTLKWARKSNEPHCSLGALAKKYKIGHNNAHRALADAGATKELFFILDNLKVIDRPNEDIAHYRAVADKVMARYARML